MRTELIQANEIQKIERDHLTFEAWGNLLNRDQFLLRESELRKTQWCVDGMVTWMLLSEKGTPLASCETYEMHSHFKRGNNGISLGIGSVYVEPKLRGKGYSIQLLKELLRYLKDSTKEIHAAILFSEIGESIYEKSGFNSVLSKEWRFLVHNDLVINHTKNPMPLFLDNLTDFEQRRNYDNRCQFLIWPTESQLHWHFKRESLYSSFLLKPKSKQFGLYMGDSYLIWMIDFKLNVLRILLSSFENSDDANLLMQSAIEYARQFELAEVRMWANILEEEPLDKWNPKYLHQRSDSIAMLYPIDSQLQVSDWSNIHRGIWI